MKPVVSFMVMLLQFLTGFGQVCPSGLIDRYVSEIPLEIENDSLLLSQALSAREGDLSCLLLELRDHFYKDRKYRQAAIFGNALAAQEGRRDVYNNDFVLAESYFEVGLEDSCLIHSIPIFLKCMEDPIKDEARTIAALKFVTVTLMEKLQFDVAREFLDYGKMVLEEKGLKEAVLFGELLYGLGVWEARTEEGDAVRKFEEIVKIFRKFDGKNDYLILKTKSALLKLYCWEGELEKAKKMIGNIESNLSNNMGFKLGDFVSYKFNKSLFYILNSENGKARSEVAGLLKQYNYEKISPILFIKNSIFEAVNELDMGSLGEASAILNSTYKLIESNLFFPESFGDVKSSLLSLSVLILQESKATASDSIVNEIYQLRRKLCENIIRQIFFNFHNKSFFDYSSPELHQIFSVIDVIGGRVASFDDIDLFNDFLYYSTLLKQFNLEFTSSYIQDKLNLINSRNKAILSKFKDNSLLTKLKVRNKKSNLLVGRLIELERSIATRSVALEVYNSFLAERKQWLISIESYLNRHEEFTFLNFVRTDVGLYVALFNSQKRKVVKLLNFPNDTFDTSVRLFINSISKMPGDLRDSTYEQLGVGLFSEIIAPVYADLTKNVVVSPHSNLYGFPFSVLLKKEPKDFFDYRSYPYLCESTNILRCNNLFSFLNLETEKTTIKGGLLGFAPAFTNSFHELEFGPLKYNQDEVQNAVNLFGGLALLGEDATQSKLNEHIKKFDIVHFSTHATYDSIKHYSNLLYKTKGNLIGKIDLTENEDLYHTSKLIVLGGCKTSLSSGKIGRGYQGLNNRLFDIGVKGVISTDWNTNDYSSFKLNDFFYSKLLKGGDVSNSLWESKFEYLQNMPNELCHPYYWAGLNYLGDPSLKYSSDDSIGLKYLVLIVAAIFFLSLYRFHNTLIRGVKKLI